MAVARAVDFEGDHYHVLGLSHRGSAATQEEIRDAYKELAKARHPDKGGRKEDFQALHRAYSVLGDSKARAGYDSAQYLKGVRASEARGTCIPEEQRDECGMSSGRGRRATLYLGRTIGVIGLLSAYYFPYELAWWMTNCHFWTVRKWVSWVKWFGEISVRTAMGYIPVVSPALRIALGLSAGLGLVLTCEELAHNPKRFHHFLKGAAAGLAEGATDSLTLIRPLLEVAGGVGGPLVNHLLPGEECVRTKTAVGEASRPAYVYFCSDCREWLCSHCAYHCHKDHRVGKAIPSGEVGQQGCTCGLPECADPHREPVASLITDSGDDIEDGEWLQIDYAPESTRRPDVQQDYVMIGN